MPAIPRRFRPLIFAVACWLLIFLVPATRRGVAEAWHNRFSAEQDESRISPDWRFVEPQLDLAALAKRFPDDKRVEIHAARHSKAALGRLMERYPQDAFIVTLALREQMNNLNSGRNEGPLTNPNYPAAPPKPNRVPTSSWAEWNRLIALARRGQKLEPNNTYFDWLLLYGLYSTRQDDAARAVLAQAARKTGYDDHVRDATLNHLSVLHLAYSAPLSPRDQFSTYEILLYEYGSMTQVARWAMEGAIIDRQSGRHDRALNAAFDVLRLGRVMRRESYFVLGAYIGRACQRIALQSVTMPKVKRPLPVRLGTPLAAFQNDPTMLYSFATSRGRGDITQFLDAEWVELGKWQKLKSSILEEWTANSPALIVTIVAAERFAALVVKMMPSLVILGAIFGLLAHRFRDDSGVPSAFWRGAVLGTLLLILAVGCEALIVLRSRPATPPPNAPLWLWFSANRDGLLSMAPSWVSCGVALVLVCLAWKGAVAWQKWQAGREVSLRTRLKTAFESPEDGLVGLDFGWILELAARLTGWILLVGTILLVCFNFDGIRRELGMDSSSFSTFSMTCAFLIFVFLLQAEWRTRPRRRQTLRLGARLAAENLAGFFVAASVLYTLVAFALWPLAARHERNFENSVQRGSLAIARAKLGL